MDIVLGFLRALLAGIGGWAVARGYIDADQIEPMVGAVLVLAVACWSAYSKFRQRRKFAEALATPPPEVKQ